MYLVLIGPSVFLSDFDALSKKNVRMHNGRKYFHTTVGIFKLKKKIQQSFCKSIKQETYDFDALLRLIKWQQND